MSTPLRLVAFVALVAAGFGLAWGVGYAVGPVARPEPVAARGAGHGAGHGAGGREAAPQASSDSGTIPGGLLVSQDGYTFRLATTTVAAGSAVPVSFTISGPDGRPVTAYEVAHEKRLHLIAVRRDLTGFQHVHPELDDRGTWHADLDLRPGQWRLFADFAATGAEPLTLGADLAVPGRVPAPSPATVSPTAKVDGYTVTLDGDLAAGEDARLTLRVTKGGEPVTDLQPYLGAYGHLVALRRGDLAYLHVHPDGAPGDGRTEPGPEVVFHTTVPSTGSYRLFLDFRHEGVVRTAAFSLGTSQGTSLATDDASKPSVTSEADTDSHDDSHGGHR